MCGCIHVYIYLSLYAYIYIYTYTYIYIHTYTYTYSTPGQRHAHFRRLLYASLSHPIWALKWAMSPRIAPHIQMSHVINMYWNASCYTYVLECVTSYICVEMSHGTESRDTHVLKWVMSPCIMPHMKGVMSYMCVRMSHGTHMCWSEAHQGKLSHICVGNESCHTYVSEWVMSHIFAATSHVAASHHTYVLQRVMPNMCVRMSHVTGSHVTHMHWFHLQSLTYTHFIQPNLGVGKIHAKRLNLRMHRMQARVKAYMCMCVCERERKRGKERESKCKGERERERERDRERER